MDQNHDDWHHERIAFYVRIPDSLIGQYAIQVLARFGDRRDWPALAETFARLGSEDRTLGCEVMEANRPVEEVILETMSAIDAGATITLLGRILQDEAKAYLHDFALRQLKTLAGR
jgi:hypothetical protein